MGNHYSSAKTKGSLRYRKSQRSHRRVISKIPTVEYEPIKTDEESQSKKYYLPNDDDDVDRQHTHHFLKRFLFQGCFSSPIEDKLIEGGSKVLDVGCGGGTWLLDVASIYRYNSYVGLDLRPVFPIQIKPENLTFIEADILDGLPFSDNEFDFVRIDTMTQILTSDQWNDTISELLRVTKQGGYVEICDAFTYKIGYGPVLLKIYNAYSDCALQQRDVDINFALHLGEILESQNNVTNVYRDERTIVVGPNGNQPGIIMQDLFVLFCSTDSAVESFCPYMNMSKDKCKEFILNELKKELKRTKAEYNVIRYWAQKN